MARWLRTIGVATLGLLAGLALLEGIGHLLPVFDGIRIQPVSDASPYARMTPDRVGTWSRGPFLADPQRFRVNNAGFVNSADYTSAADTPALAVVGDSYVEALAVPHPAALQERLAARLDGTARVYSFAISGAALPQYLAWAALARDHYRAAALAVLVVANDYDEGLLSVWQRPGFHFFAGGAAGPGCGIDLVRLDHAPSPLRPVIRRSALAQYLVFNLNVTYRFPALAALLRPATAVPTGEAAGEADVACAIDAFLDRLPGAAGLPPARIVLLVDAPAGHDPPGTAARRARLIDGARARGIEAIDLGPAFAAHRAGGGARLDIADDDPHWSAAAHALAADALAASATLARLRAAH